ncbi:hypothetical protein MRB53_032717 [Persea americana]|uniref:Uncharacterized protein n=1 Tax=Persea americana TaxID=3435 RepID=A0ACC2KT03_PERAE|nr:hypothetical protein MRB53_032717 [Persea americana]
MASSPSPAFRVNGGAASMGSLNGDDGGGCLRDDEREMDSGKEILFRSLAARRRRQYCEDEEGAPEGGGAVTMLSRETELLRR